MTTAAFNEAELLTRLWAHQAAAAAIEATLKEAALRESRDKGVAVTWRVKGVGNLTVSTANDKVRITDPEKWLDWLAARYPTEVRVEQVIVRQVISPAWEATVLAGLTPLDPDELPAGGEAQVMDSEGTLIPGVVWTKGGKILTAAITADGDLKRRFAAAAAAYVKGAPMPAIDPPPPPVEPATDNPAVALAVTQADDRDQQEAA